MTACGSWCGWCGACTSGSREARAEAELAIMAACPHAPQDRVIAPGMVMHGSCGLCGASAAYVRRTETRTAVQADLSREEFEARR